MCLLVVLRGFHPTHPILVGANRDERTDRKAAPPGLWIGARHRMLCPRDRVGGGTWLAVNECGRFAGITNLHGAPQLPTAPSRGLLPLLALDQVGIEAAAEAVTAKVAATPHSGFQLVLCDHERTLVLRYDGVTMKRIEWTERVLLVTNRHGPGEYEPAGFGAATTLVLGVGAQLDALVPLLTDRGGDDGHVACKHGDEYATVSSSLIAVPASDPLKLHWRFAAGPPDRTRFRNYGNLGRRLLPDDQPTAGA